MVPVEFILTSLIVVLVPGTGVIYTVSNGLSGSRRSAVYAAFGCTLGIVPHLTAGILGLSAIMHMSARVFQLIKFAGCIYLLYLAWSMWRSSGTISFNGSETGENAFRIIIRGILLNLLNPKLTLFFFAFLPVFIPAEALSPERQMTLLSLIFMLMTFIVFAIYGLLASFVKSRFSRSEVLSRRIQKTFALLLVPMAVKLALSEQ